nr:ABC transporter permease [uncultured Holophaga sp.]
MKTTRTVRSAALRALSMENVRFAFRSIITQKLRSFLTLLGIMAGVGTVIAMVSFVVGFNNEITKAFTQFGTTLVQFQKYEPRHGGGGELPEDQKKRRDLTLADAQALKRLCPLVGAVSPERYLGGTASASVIIKNRRGDQANAPVVTGVAPDYCQANNHYVSDGRFFTEADLTHASRVAIIGQDVVKALYPRVDPIGQEILLNGIPFSIGGVLEEKGSLLGGSNDNWFMVPISTFDELFPEVKNGGKDTLHIATVPKDPARMAEMMDQETAILRARRGLRPNQPNDFAIFTSEGQLKTFQAVTSGIAGAMILIAGIALLVGGVGVMNIMLVSVTERTREIGVRKALGATRRDIAAQFLVEAIALTGVGGAIGIAAGLGIAMTVRVLFKFPAAAPLWSILLGFGVSTAIGLIFGMWPALKAASQDPIEALRYE